MSAELDQDVLATLTDEERAAIESDELTESEKEALKSIAGGDEDDEDDEDDDDAVAAQPIEGKAASDNVDDAQQPSGQDDSADEGRDAGTFRPAFKADVPEDFDQQLADLDTRLDDLATQFKDGEIDFDQYRAEARGLETQRADLQSAKLRADIYKDMTAQSAEQEWQWTVGRFVRSTAKAGDIDYAKDDAKRADLDTFVKALAQVEANADKDYEWFLAEAHKRVKALHGLAAPTPKTPPPASRKPPTDAAPVTLAQVPGGDGPGDLAGEFADIDGLEGDALEMAIARMSPERREQYARGA